VFGRNNPKILEIGCGMGETTAKIAEAQSARTIISAWKCMCPASARCAN
jgi:tRNA G46 methylase TrmB